MPGLTTGNRPALKLGLAISAAIVAVFIGVLVAVNREGAPDPPTDAVRPDRLARMDLPADLPALHTPARPDADATAAYDRPLGHAQRHAATLQRTSGTDTREAADTLRGLLIDAAEAGRVESGFLDRYVPLEPGAEASFGEALSVMLRAMLAEADRLADAGDTEAARRTLLATWVLGRRTFEDNERLFNRRRGLQIMQHVGGALLERARAGDAALDAGALARWAAALNEIEAAWQPKLEALLSVEPHAADLIEMAEHDEDRTFRLAATLRLGIARHTADGSANRAAAKRAIQRLRESDDPLIADAAAAAAALTREDLRRLH